MESKIIFGINMSHDTSCAAVVDGEVKVAIEEERLNGVKHCDGRSPYGRIIPFLSIQYCCKALNITPNDVDVWVVNAVYNSAIDALQRQLIGIPKEKIYQVELPGHHLAHAYSAFYPSQFTDTAVLTLDVNGGLSQDNTLKENYSVYHGMGSELKPVFLDHLKHGELSVPELYTIYGTLLQLSPSEDGDYGKDDSQRSGGKLMGYAAHFHNHELIRENKKLFKRNPNTKKLEIPFDELVSDHKRFTIPIEGLVSNLKKRGWVKSVREYADFSKVFAWSLGGLVNWNYRETSMRDWRNIEMAHEAQLFLEEGIIRMAKHAHELTGSKNICVAGGSMLNVVACNRILKETAFENIFVQPAANDGGNSIGAALYGYHKLLGGSHRPYTNGTVYKTYLGDQYNETEVNEAINDNWLLPFNHSKNTEDEQIDKAVEFLSNEKVICVFKGRSEFGPRALGNRSFLASPARAEMLEYMNELKGREWYRPVAPIVLEDALHEYFDAPFDSAPFMTINAHCKENARELAPAICHVDGSARVQTVSEKYNPFITKLLRQYAKKTGRPPILINTSFNIGGPIVEVPRQAIDTFLRGNYMVKALFLEDYVLELDEFDKEM